MRKPRHETAARELPAKASPHRRVEIEAMRSEAKELRAAKQEARRHVLENLSSAALKEISIHDLEAAVLCLCGCHPSMEPGTHSGKLCGCQKTPEERRTEKERFFQQLQEFGEQFLEVSRREREEALSAAAQQLDVSIESAGGAAPYQIIGSVHGTRFYLRERHGEWQLRVPDERAGPDGDPTGINSGTYVIAEGPAEDIYDDEDLAKPLKEAVRAVEEHLRRKACQHADARKYCPDCGSSTVES